MSAPRPYRLHAPGEGFPDTPETGVASRVLHIDDDIRVVAFSLAGAAEMSEHLAPHPAVVQVLRGEVEFTLDGEVVTLLPGSWLHMDRGARHAVRARTPAAMLLTLLRRGGAGAP